MQLLLPKEIKKCLEALTAAGFEAWCVGGAVRDMIMGRIPGDFDVTTNAHPDEIISLFDKTVPTGLKHGTVTVIIEKMPIEVTTYRTDGNYSDHRSPDSVEYVSSLEDDLQRRDFTVNAICCDVNGKIHDPLNGTNDIKSKILRTVGNPEVRFTEDALRIMRLFRFSSQLDFTIEENTLLAAIKLSYLLREISVERIYKELTRLICGPAPQNADSLFYSGALNYLGLNKMKLGTVLNDCPPCFSLRFAVLCKKSGVNANIILKNLKSDKTSETDTETYLKLLSMKSDTRQDIKRMLNIGGIEKCRNILAFYGHSPATLDDILKNKEPYNKSMLAVNGTDIKNIGINGEKIGQIIDYLTDTVIEDPPKNNREALIKAAKDNADL